jgi:hypothetical protein
MAQYVSLPVLRQQHGDAVTRRFLAAEMDTYLRSRSRATVREQPLARAEGQDYVSYQKGVIVLDLLRELVGERRQVAADDVAPPVVSASGHRDSRRLQACGRFRWRRAPLERRRC